MRLDANHPFVKGLRERGIKTFDCHPSVPAVKKHGQLVCAACERPEDGIMPMDRKSLGAGEYEPGLAE